MRPPESEPHFLVGLFRKVMGVNTCTSHSVRCSFLPLSTMCTKRPFKPPHATPFFVGIFLFLFFRLLPFPRRIRPRASLRPVFLLFETGFETASPILCFVPHCLLFFQA